MRELKKRGIVYGRETEYAIMRWWLRKGRMVLPIFELNDGAPLLRALEESAWLIVPDLLVAYRGRSFWVEVKRKSGGNIYRRTGTLETGFDAKHWDHYLGVRQTSGLRVFIMFVHESENLVTCDEIGVLATHPQMRRSEANANNPSFINWPLFTLHRVASYKELELKEGTKR